MKTIKLKLGRNNRDLALYHRHSININSLKNYLHSAYSIGINPLPALRTKLGIDIVFTYLPFGKPDPIYSDCLVVYVTTDYDRTVQAVDCQFFPTNNNSIFNTVIKGA